MTAPGPDRERLIRELMARRGLATATRPAGIPRRSPGTRVPLSPMQEGMWFLDRLQPGNPAYVLNQAVAITGRLDLAALQSALDEVVAAHDALRTRFVERNGAVEQVVLPADDPAARCRLVVEDLTTVPRTGREAAVVAAVRRESETPFDLGRAPLVRVRVGRLDVEEHLLVVSLHHIVADERSLDIVLTGLLDGHRRRLTGAATSPAPPAVHFPDYVLWQHDRLAGAAADRLRSFWADRLAGSSGLLDLPTDRPRPATQTFPGRTHGFAVADDLVAALDSLAHRTGCTRFMILLAGLQVLLARLGGTDDVCVASPVTLRTDAEQQQMVGLLVNSLPLRTDLAGDPTLAEALARVRGTCVASLAHAELPFERIVETVRLPRDLSRNPLFQVMLVLNQAGVAGPRAGLAVRPVSVLRETSRLDLTVAVHESPAGLSGLVDYNTDLFDQATIDRFVDRFRSVLWALATRAHLRLSELDLTGPAERRDLAAWNATDRAYPAGVGLHELVSARAAADPQAPALLDVSPDEPDRPALTYGRLDADADRLAAHLCRLGVRPDEPVGLALAAGRAAVTGLLAILKAGAGYLPLDPTHPPARLRALLTAAGTTVCLTDADLAATIAAPPDEPDDQPYAGTVLAVDTDGLPVGTAGRTVDTDGPPVDGGPAGDPPPVAPRQVHPDQLAYVIHTSGSTGTPKGVMVSHRTAVNLALAFADLHGIGPGDRLLMLPPLSFDASVGDLFPALVSGAAIVVHRQPAAITGAGLTELCRTHGLTLVDTAAPLWARWVGDLAAQPDAVDVGPLRAMMVGGEAVDLETVRRWAGLTAGRVTLHNHYGPTEATVCATTYATVDANELPGLTRLPIGRPVPNVRVHVLDADLRPVPIGLVGEVFVGGTAPARGYLGNAAETAGSFVPDPYGPPGSRLYRTGDLARHRADGTLEFLGRTDQQVKIRGHRIEIGEVEAACATLPGVRRTAVVVDHAPAGPRLVAYMVGDDTVPDGPAARTALRRRLPEHLVPACFVRVPDLPTNRHGKLDLAALPRPEETDRPAHEPPTTPTEKALADIWAELLDTGPVGRQDNFFDLGGHSLLAASVVTRIRAALGVDLPLRELFSTADLAGLAAVLDGAGPTADAGGDLLRAEARLADDLAVPPGVPAAPPRSVLCTGATGFLGAYLLADWLAASTATVHCLVRADTPAAALDRVRANLHRYGLWRPEYADRLVGVPGDLGAPRLGLTGVDFAELGERLDAIVHNGGVVNFVQPYPALRPANVGGTLEVLRLATTGRPSAVHFVSTLGVFVTPSRTGTLVREGDVPADCDGLHDGYNGSKWVADALVRAARERGLPVGVHRPARITGDAGSGVGNTDDFFSRLLKTCVQLGAVPEIDDPADLAPVDYVGAGIGHLTRTGSTADHHYYNNRTMSYAALADALASFGYPVTLVAYPRWRAALLDRPDAALARFAPLFGADTPVRTQPDFDCTGTETVLAAAGITCPAADERLLHTYLAAFVAAGFLDPPPGRAHG
ncbi:amino acid adenylation domain-containing protein/thioester reductase domain-containing protein [Micromonospora nigra]|uniref:Amino acid adenylation domain-containing protein/thioester reductase domain-containing protein n=1 Tax=Micromonospora nigra TaxID=145857 RepID=A0A1C6RBQ1_9ACTN|nr:non-ribosomal peptide synthetase [Micromonospora nigra]SCL14529.1 amino acid adenylation domain-containing protein/thioester reductase domain-containing protein [Micromonospora nigra]